MLPGKEQENNCEMDHQTTVDSICDSKATTPKETTTLSPPPTISLFPFYPPFFNYFLFSPIPIFIADY